MKQFVISHSVYLDKTQRATLQAVGSFVEVLGITVPVCMFENNKTDEPAKEIVCKYKIIHSTVPEEPIRMEGNGYIIAFNKALQCERLLSVKEGGSGGLFFNYNTTMRNIPMLHQVSILNLEMFDLSACCFHLDQIVSK
jgi:hypothetical protein